MGTQQNLLIVLGVIIVGIAIYVGIQLYNQHQEDLILDQVDQLLINAAKSGIAHLAKPVELGGCGNDLKLFRKQVKKKDYHWLPDASSAGELLFIQRKFPKGFRVDVYPNNKEFRITTYLARTKDVRRIQVQPSTGDMIIAGKKLKNNAFK
ncbi:hypothetical protein ACFLS9_00495 [Bacteroidota bacterium]